MTLSLEIRRSWASHTGGKAGRTGLKELWHLLRVQDIPCLSAESSGMQWMFLWNRGARFSLISYLVGGWFTPLKNMSSSIGMISNPIDGKTKLMFQATNQLWYLTDLKPKVAGFNTIIWGWMASRLRISKYTVRTSLSKTACFHALPQGRITMQLPMPIRRPTRMFCLIL